MKALLVVANDDVARLAGAYLRPLGMDIIRYRDPLKALDNLEEIYPDVVVMSARDFPRHWKSIVVNIRAVRPKTACTIVLLKGDFFSFEEAAKASHLEVNGVVKEDLEDIQERIRFQQLMKRYLEIDESRVTDRQAPGPGDRFAFAFCHPATLAPIAGKVETISSMGLSFVPDWQALAADLEAGTAIPDAALRVGEAIMVTGARLVRNGAVMAFAFDGMGADDKRALSAYLASRSDREMKAMLKNT